MPFQIVRNDITTMKVDAIVNSSNTKLIGAGGVDELIHHLAGPKMDKACEDLGGCKPGEAKVTPGFRLPCRYVIHTVTPIWLDGHYNEKEKLASCYRNSLRLADELHCESIAFPLMSAGINGFPRGQALAIATETIRTWLDTHYLDVYLVVYDKKSFILSEQIQENVQQFIDDHYIASHPRSSILADACEAALPSPRRRIFTRPIRSVKSAPDKLRDSAADLCCGLFETKRKPITAEELSSREWELDESFSQMLLRKIDESGMTDAQCYNRANVDRRLFSKIRSDPKYHPSKMTVIALSIALELPLHEMECLLRKAGYALSESYLCDVIIRYFVSRGCYDIFTINEVLFDKDQPILYSRS